MKEAKKTVSLYPDLLNAQKEKRYDEKTLEFLDYWFTKEVQLELFALLVEIEKDENIKVRDFFKVVYSSIIITKTGGVSLALDLAHTSTQSKDCSSRSGEVISGNKNETKQHLIKILRSPIDEFEKKLNQNLRGIIKSSPSSLEPIINFGNAQSMPLPSNSVDLIITSPPYASNAIDYMRAHKFSLVWFNYSIESLTKKRKTYIGSEGLADLPETELPKSVENLVNEIEGKSKSKGVSLRRYYIEMTLVLQEMFRVLKPEKSVIMVVGNSILAGLDAQIEDSLVEIGKKIGFDIPSVGIRQLDRNHRMMPTGSSVDITSQIQQRMHEEYVIGFYKP